MVKFSNRKDTFVQHNFDNIIIVHLTVVRTCSNEKQEESLKRTVHKDAMMHDERRNEQQINTA